MNEPDIRWQQRFTNYKKVLVQLQSAVELTAQRPLSDLEKQGMIQVFEFTHELAWNLLKDYLQDQGYQNIKGSKDATRQAFKVELITNGEQWMAMIQSRNKSLHTKQTRNWLRRLAVACLLAFCLLMPVERSAEAKILVDQPVSISTSQTITGNPDLHTIQHAD
jgi:nucleotidyltransferase substrate binding protein (TIGR01987 family)